MASIPLATGAKLLEIKDWLRALIDPAICSKDQESIETASKPTIVGDGQNCALIAIK
jgi:hypothetical protein